MSRILAGLFALLALVSRLFGADRPNILLCMADDWGWPHAGSYGDEVVKTPTFDRIAREGVLFEHAFVAAPSCSPSRNALLTGQHFYRLDQGANLQSTLDIKHPNFMRRLEEAGYGIGHWRKVWGPGVHEAGGYEAHPAGQQMGFDEFLRHRDKEQPFCFFFGTSDPHRPYEAGSAEKAGIDPQTIKVPPFLPDVDEVRGDLAEYYHEVQRWDSDVGRALQLLEEAGELENTIVVITGDNGMPFPRSKGSLYDWGSRTPLAIRWGSEIQAPGRRAREFVTLVDLAPTFLEAAGVEVPKEMTGRSLLPILRNQVEADDARWSFAVYGRERHAAAQEMPSLAGYPSRAIRTERYLLILNLEPQRWPHGVPANATHPIGSFPDTDNGPAKQFIVEHADDPRYRAFFELCFARRPAVELYDVQADPAQIRNIAGDPANQEVIDRLRGHLAGFLGRTGDPRFTGEPVQFDEHPYRDQRIHRRIEEWRDRQGAPVPAD